MGRLAPQQAAGSREEPQTIYHPAHAHVLCRVYLAYGAAVCDGCKDPCGAGVAYSCDPCNYVLHKACATAPPTLIHGGHEHALAFAEKPPYPDGRFICNACRGRGEGFCFRCNLCNFDLHLHCVPASELLNPQGSTAAGSAGTASSSAERSTGMSGVQMGVTALQGAAAAASLTHHGLHIHRMMNDQHGAVAANSVPDASVTDAASAADLADAGGEGGGFLSTIFEIFFS